MRLGCPLNPFASSFTIVNSTSIEKSHYASLVTAVYSYIARGACRRRSCVAQISGAGGVYPAAFGGNLLLSVPRQPVVQQNHGDCSPGDGQDWAGVFFAGAASAGGLGGFG